MSSPSAGKRRIDTDVIKLIESKHEVTISGGLNEFNVKFYGPKGTAYEGGVWRVRVDLPEKYPFKSPSIGFMNRIFHPNIDESSGTVCLDVINQAWTALYDLANIFDSFLPQLLAYPNPQDPLNNEAAKLYLHQREDFNDRCAEYVRKFANEDAVASIVRDQYREYAEEEENDTGNDSDSTISDFEDDELCNMEF
jgi:ubiquitin-conjugating enzyme E2 H